MAASSPLQLQEKEFVYSSFRLHENGLSPIGTPTHEQWVACGRFLRHAEASVHFWIGDWLRYGEVHFKDDYDEAIKLTGYNYHTLRRDKYLAERIPFERRRSHLDVAFHHEVAPLETQHQEMLLDKVESEKLTVQQLRMEKHRLTIELQRPLSSSADPGLLLGDCLELLQKIPDESIDLLLTDPPYGLNYQSEHKIIPDDRLVNDSLNDALHVLDQALASIQRKMKKTSHLYIFTSWKTDHLVKPIIMNYFGLKNILVWDKGNWTAGDLESNYGQVHEFIIYAHHQGRRHLNGRRDASILKFNRVAENTPQRHPTQKPLSLLEYLIQKSTQEGEVVLDPFMGSGSTCLAAKNTKRKYIGIEIDEKYFKIAQDRMSTDNK